MAEPRTDCPRCQSVETTPYRSAMYRNGVFGGPLELWCSDCGLVFSVAADTEDGRRRIERTPPWKLGEPLIPPAPTVSS